MYSFLHPSWREEPRQVLELVKGYLEYGTEHNPKQHEAEQIAARREATRFVLRRLTHGLRKLIPFQRLVFKTLLRLTHAYARLRENQQFYVGMTFPIARQTMLALGRTLVDDGVITDPIHGFFLTNEELRAFVDGSLGASDLRRRYRSRLAEYERFASYDPPKLIGGAAGGTRPAPEEGVETLSGAGVSAGVVHGQAKVVRNPDEFDKIKRGDILVAPTTTPTWTPLFVMASGLVTDIGGTLSHGAVVSREYGIPAVMGTGDATQVIEDGDWIVVDGERGLVWKTPPPDETA